MMDLIYRKQALKEISERHNESVAWFLRTIDNDETQARAESALDSFMECYLIIQRLPSAETKTAVWTEVYDEYADGNVAIHNWYCSNCDYCPEDDEKPDWNYCPNCGAKMEVVK